MAETIKIDKSKVDSTVATLNSEVGINLNNNVGATTVEDDSKDSIDSCAQLVCDTAQNLQDVVTKYNDFLNQLAAAFEDRDQELANTIAGGSITVEKQEKTSSADLHMAEEGR